MKTLRITIVHELEVPDECEIVQRSGEKLLKLGEIHIQPDIEYMQSVHSKENGNVFQEMDGSAEDMIYDGMTYEKVDIIEL